MLRNNCARLLILVISFCVLRPALPIGRQAFCASGSGQGEFVYDPQNKRNPFIPLVTSDGRFLRLDAQEGSSVLSLEGIIYDKGGVSYAIVNGEVASVGDTIGGYVVLKIENNRVIFVKDGQPLQIELNKEEE